MIEVKKKNYFQIIFPPIKEITICYDGSLCQSTGGMGTHENTNKLKKKYQNHYKEIQNHFQNKYYMLSWQALSEHWW